MKDNSDTVNALNETLYTSPKHTGNDTVICWVRTCRTGEKRSFIVLVAILSVSNKTFHEITLLLAQIKVWTASESFLPSSVGKDDCG